MIVVVRRMSFVESWLHPSFCLFNSFPCTHTQTIHVHQVARRINRSPLGEIEFWRERATSLSALYEQINMPRVQQMVQVLKLSEFSQLNTFQFHFGELTKLYMEAKDNVKFLTTLERHFKHLTEGSFVTINDSMFAMLNGLKMVWVISRHFNSDERMSPLMENIAKTLVKRVREEVGKRVKRKKEKKNISCVFNMLFAGNR